MHDLSNLEGRVLLAVHEFEEQNRDLLNRRLGGYRVPYPGPFDLDAREALARCPPAQRQLMCVEWYEWERGLLYAVAMRVFRWRPQPHPLRGLCAGLRRVQAALKRLAAYDPPMLTYSPTARNVAVLQASFQVWNDARLAAIRQRTAALRLKDQRVRMRSIDGTDFLVLSDLAKERSGDVADSLDGVPLGSLAYVRRLSADQVAAIQQVLPWRTVRAWWDAVPSFSPGSSVRPRTLVCFQAEPLEALLVATGVKKPGTYFQRLDRDSGRRHIVEDDFARDGGA